MVKYEQLTPRCQHLADKIQRLMQETGGEKHLIQIGLPEGFEKDQLVTYLSQTVATTEHRITYVAVTNENIGNVAKNFNRK